MIAVTKFSGGGGVDLGMEAAGWEHAYGIEYDDKIASVARSNGLNTITADILKIKPSDYPGMDWMHDSPPCPNFSTAKANAEETENDLALAQAVCNWIVYHRPKFYSLENVYGYRKSKSWAMIADTLHRQGYQFNFWHVNFANYAVPQTRKRMIVIARRDGIMPQLPEPTHAENPQAGLFGTEKRWISWFEAIEDLIPTLPDSQFAPWQLERLPMELSCSFIANLHIRESEESAAISLTQPAQTVTIAHGAAKHRAFIMDAANPNSNGQTKYRNDDESAKTITSGDSLAIKAFVSGGNASSSQFIGNAPSHTVTATDEEKSRMGRAIANGRVVKMTPRALARFQSFPDWYELPESNTLATRIIGNAVPPLFMQRVGEMFAESMNQ